MENKLNKSKYNTEYIPIILYYRYIFYNFVQSDLEDILNFIEMNIIIIIVCILGIIFLVVL